MFLYVVRVFIVTSQYSICIYIFMYSCGDLIAQLAPHPFSCFKIIIMAINVEPDSRTSSSMVAPSSADPDGGGDRGSGPPPQENYKNIGFLSNTGSDPLKITKLPIKHSMLGHYRPASETPFRWRADDDTLIVVSPHQTKKHCQSWTPSDKTFWIRTWP